MSFVYEVPPFLPAPSPLRAFNEPTKSKAFRLAKIKARKAFEQPDDRKGVHVEELFELASQQCAAKVHSIARAYRARNQKYRDPDFDIGNNSRLCLFGAKYPTNADERYDPADTMRVTEIWDKPRFISDTPSSSDIQQGALGDCYFLAALANVAMVPGLLEKICVARDEAVGVYGFIFWHDDTWAEVIIDDQLYVDIPKFESADPVPRHYYHDDPDLYDTTARKGNKILYFARCATEGETWVPLIEKAYAKLHGNYHYLDGGWSGEAIEDLTGGVSYDMLVSDILDRDLFWEQLVNGTGHVYQCLMSNVDEVTSGGVAKTLLGLQPYHAYTVLRAVEYNGKRFVVVRNPWGKDEWKGRWADGSKEWTTEWLPALGALGHSFGNDGQFVMEYSDFLRYWTSIECTKLFDSSWVASSIWVQVDGLDNMHPFSWGDVSFTISVPKDTPAVVVLQRTDNQYFRDVKGYMSYAFDFAVFKRGSEEEYIPPSPVDRRRRGRGVEVELEAGEYVVHVRINSWQRKAVDYGNEIEEAWDTRALKRIYAQKARAYSKAMNFPKEQWENVVPVELAALAGKTLADYELGLVGKKKQKLKPPESKAHKTAAASDFDESSDEDESEENKGGNEEANEGTETDEGDNNEKGEKNEEIKEDDDNESTASFKTSNEEQDGEEREETTGEREEGSISSPVIIKKLKRLPAHPVRCTFCRMLPILGARYTCTRDRCKGMNICQQCYDGNVHPVTHEMLRQARPRKIVHKNVFCKICTKGPIIGTRYKCQECEEFDICSTCVEKKTRTHRRSHVVLIMPLIDEPESDGEEEEEQQLLQGAHEGISCSECRMNPIIGPRFKCLENSCSYYNLCADCVTRAIHPSSHPMIPIVEPEEADRLRPVPGDVANILLGLRVYTKVDSVAVLGAQLKGVSLSKSK